MSGHELPAGFTAALQRAERAVTALLPNDEELRATCCSILERAKIDVGQPAPQRPQLPKLPRRSDVVTRLQPLHRNRPSRTELYDALEELYELVWPDDPTVIRMQKRRAAASKEQFLE